MRFIIMNMMSKVLMLIAYLAFSIISAESASIGIPERHGTKGTTLGINSLYESYTSNIENNSSYSSFSIPAKNVNLMFNGGKLIKPNGDIDSIKLDEVNFKERKILMGFNYGYPGVYNVVFGAVDEDLGIKLKFGLLIFSRLSGELTFVFPLLFEKETLISLELPMGYIGGNISGLYSGGLLNIKHKFIDLTIGLSAGTWDEKEDIKPFQFYYSIGFLIDLK